MTEPGTAALVEHRQMTLTEFLLARIAEDESVIGEPPHSRDWTPYYAESRNRLEFTHDGLTIEPARAWAECEAKRRIVEMHAYVGDACAGHPGPWMPHADYGSGHCKRGDEDVWELRHLAAIYADHPDYREEWRP